MTNIAIEHGHRNFVDLPKMVISLHSYVSLPQGTVFDFIRGCLKQIQVHATVKMLENKTKLCTYMQQQMCSYNPNDRISLWYVTLQ